LVTTSVPNPVSVRVVEPLETQASALLIQSKVQS